VSEFGSALRRLAGLHDLTNRETAAVLGLSEQSISELQSGKREPSLQTVGQVAQVFGVDGLAMQEGIEAILHQVGDPERFERAEKEIKRRRGMKWVTDEKGYGRLEVTDIDSKRSKKRTKT
jgi:transcriptional regulator with XRE-family HTH domain